ncbi:hypothetical protein DSCOOX_37690 [Desulfosarcina ovata subsp. ovata]|uniref:Uncharacterized protein n=2 Tax=Desulfosarcina ovata TaxID=83564 RepID=A0A5K8ADF7_9BACT|nr:hypothetical protein DSCOOX_37690 [Desulfosarcina ovata subsp. ovata]
MFGDLRSMIIDAMGNWKTGNQLSPFWQPVIPIYIVDFDPDPDFDFDKHKPELHAIALRFNRRPAGVPLAITRFREIGERRLDKPSGNR